MVQATEVLTGKACADEDDAQVHPEVEDLEDLRLGEGQHDDPAELGQRDA